MKLYLIILIKCYIFGFYASIIKRQNRSKVKSKAAKAAKQQPKKKRKVGGEAAGGEAAKKYYVILIVMLYNYFTLHFSIFICFALFLCSYYFKLQRSTSTTFLTVAILYA